MAGNTFPLMPAQLRAARLGHSLAAGTAVLLAATTVGALVAHPQAYRFLFAAVIVIDLLIVALARPRVGALVTLMFLTLLALLRRLFIPEAGWTTTDPLLLVGPLVVGLMFVQLFAVERRRLATDTLSKLVLALLVLAVVQAFNPLGPGLLPNLAGLLFVGVPLLWFFVGREIADLRLIEVLLRCVVLSAVAFCVYGLWQLYVGFPSWDQEWLRVTGYSSLNVTADVTRAFGTFSSSQEFETYIGLALLASLALALHGRTLYALPIPLLSVMLLLGSSRGIFLVTVAVATLIAALRVGRGRVALLLSIVGLAAAGGAIVVAAPLAAKSSNPLIAHQGAGLANPTDPSSSTLLLHLNLMKSGFRDGISHPLGSGTGATTIASQKLAGASNSTDATQSTSQTTETDVTNSLIALGFPGPIFLLAIAFLVFRRSFSRYFGDHHPASLAAVGILLATFGGWLNGQEYAVAPLTLFVMGWAAHPSTRPVVERAPAKAMSGEFALSSP
jgi:hypothetical protein